MDTFSVWDLLDLGVKSVLPQLYFNVCHFFLKEANGKLSKLSHH